MSCQQKILDFYNNPRCCLKLICNKMKWFISKIKLKYVCFLCINILILDFFGVFTHIFELSFDDHFVYPYEGDVYTLVNILKHNKTPNVNPINKYNFSFIHDIKNHCLSYDYKDWRIVFLVKSAIENFDRRIAIRNTWGYKKRFFDVPTRIIFLLGINEDIALQSKVDIEAGQYKDIVQAKFKDSYYNNTIKTMIGIKWAKLYCSNSKFYMFIDDDMYVSVKNTLRFIRNPVTYPDYSQDSSRIQLYKREIGSNVRLPSTTWDKSRTKYGRHDQPLKSYRNEINTNSNATSQYKEMNNINNSNISIKTSRNTVSIKSNEYNSLVATNESIIRKKDRYRRQIFDTELPDDVRLFAGYVFNSSPHRHKTSKWYVSLKEYPYDMWPPYISAGAYILSKEALIDMYFTSFYTQHFRFDDIYLGIVAKKANIELFHCHEFHFYKKNYAKFNYKHVITSHGYGNSDELIQVWNEQKSMGNA